MSLGLHRPAWHNGRRLEIPLPPFRFIHTADLHLGRRFASFGDEEGAAETRAHLVTARAEQVARLAEAARAHGAVDILVAGDLFDTETPAPTVVSHALNAMGAAAPVRWWIIPGNHDSLAAEALWETVADRRPANVAVLATTAPVDLAPGVVLLPSPVTSRYPGRDLSAPMAAIETPAGAIRIGLAHGAVWSFGTEGLATIPLDRQDTARLDYLALGDRHAFTRVASRTAYPGTPERDGFSFDGPGTAVAVTIAAAGAEPVIDPIATGKFAWHADRLALLPGMDVAAALEALLPLDRAARARVLLRVAATGRASLAERAALAAAARRHQADFRHFHLDEAALTLEDAAGDLDEIAPAGPLRVAAERLASAARQGPEAERDVAAAALARLYTLTRESAR